MPLPNYGYFNKEEKKHQELLFEMAPEIVDSAEDSIDKYNPYAKESTNLSKKRAKVTTGKLGIDLERKLVIHDEKDPEVWKAPKVDSEELQIARKYATPERKDLRRQVRSSIDSLISGRKAREIRDNVEDKRKPSDLGLFLGGSTFLGTESSPPSTPVRQRFESPVRKSFPSSPISTEITPMTSSSGPKVSDFLASRNPVSEERASYFSSSSTSSYSARSSNFKSPADSVGNYSMSSHNESWSSNRKSTSIASPSERIIPVWRQ